MREWALQRWSESTQVHLAKELPRLKMEIGDEREAEEQRRLQQEQDGSEAERVEVSLQVEDARQRHRKH
jgi:G2/mitotic-specific cyclin 1/2